ncbi:unnamed protein product [Angiostrongylus costaricensis]|uniref:Major sperm protein n=1 Tax=Angiostrongylus costaricensis TaxID=334426 RepID=A0A158PKF9_ANGCS|nr:unnamed protein product [Angiostrongylus costaricensis]
METCDSDALRSARRFSFGRTISYVPTRCFQGVENRLKHECGRLIDCCPTIAMCDLVMTESTSRKAIKEFQAEIVRRAKDCEKGLQVNSLPLPRGLLPVQPDFAKWAPSGYVSVHFNEVISDEIGKGHVFLGDINTQPNMKTVFNALYNGEYSHHIRISNAFGQRIRCTIKLTNMKHLGIDPTCGMLDPKDERKYEQKTANTCSNLGVSANSSVLEANTHQNKSESKKHETEKSVERYEEEQAPKNTNWHKETVQKKSTGDAVREEHDGLLTPRQGAADIGDTRKVARSESPLIVGSVEPAEPTASGSVRSLDIFPDENGHLRDAQIVTSAPVIILANDSGSEIKNMTNHWYSKVKMLSEAPNYIEPGANGVRTSAKECYPLEAKRLTKNRVENVRKDGMERLILSGISGTMGMSVDSGGITTEKDEFVSKPSDQKDLHNTWMKQGYKLEMQKKKNKLNGNSPNRGRNETSCDLYMRCRNQMHLAVDSCAWRFANGKILPTLAESAESLLYKVLFLQHFGL